MSFEKHLFNIKNKICSCVYLYIYIQLKLIFIFIYGIIHTWWLLKKIKFYFKIDDIIKDE